MHNTLRSSRSTSPKPAGIPRPQFSNPFNPAAMTTTRPTRSTSTSSTNSTSSTISSFDPQNTISRRPSETPSYRATSPNLADILALGFATASRNQSFAMASRDERRPSCFSIREVEEERAEFGMEMLDVLEPRENLGWWGMSEVLAEGEKEAGSLAAMLG